MNGVRTPSEPRSFRFVASLPLCALRVTLPRSTPYTQPRSAPSRVCRGRPGASRHTHTHPRHRYSHTRHRHSRSHCCTRDRPHGLWETLPVCKVTHSLCKRWMNITQWAKITLQWSLRALCKPSQSSPNDSREACLWVRGMRLRWWQNRWLLMATMHTDRPVNRRQDAYSGCFFLEMRKFCS